MPSSNSHGNCNVLVLSSLSPSLVFHLGLQQVITDHFTKSSPLGTNSFGLGLQNTSPLPPSCPQGFRLGCGFQRGVQQRPLAAAGGPSTVLGRKPWVSKPPVTGGGSSPRTPVRSPGAAPGWEAPAASAGGRSSGSLNDFLLYPWFNAFSLCPSWSLCSLFLIKSVIVGLYSNFKFPQFNLWRGAWPDPIVTFAPALKRKQ